MANHDEAMEIAEEARELAYERPSFGGQLFMGKFVPSLLFPFPTQDAKDKKVGDEYIEKLSKFLEENLDPDEVERSREIPKKVFEGFTKLGVFAMKIPKEYDGLGFSQVNYNRVVHKVASYCGSTTVLISAHQSIGVPQPLKLYGTEEQKKRFLPKFREGSISAFALTEPDVGSDPAQMSSTADLSDDGSHFILNGTKLWCTNGTVADIIVVMARTAPKVIHGKERKQISAFILEMNTPGVEVTHRCEFMGLGAIYNAALKFTDVKIPKENLIGEEGRGLAMALDTINVGRLTLPAASTAAAKQCLSICRRWGKERVQWGQSIGLHEPGRQKIAYIAATTFAMDAMTWLTSHWADHGDVDIRIEAAMAKLFCTESLWEISDQSMQLRGGRGYEKSSSLTARGEPGYPIERIMRDCRINMILEGTSEIMKLFLAREAMDPHMKRAGDLIKKKLPAGEMLKKIGALLAHYGWWYPSQWIKSWFPSRYSEMGKLAKHYRFIDQTSHQIARYLFYYMARYQKGLEKRQNILGRLMEVGTELFAMATTCSYAVQKSQELSSDESPIDLADYFCTIARRRIKENLSALSDNDDIPTNKIAKRVLDNEMSWMEDNIFWMGPKE